jgi:hypothetical protein
MEAFVMSDQKIDLVGAWLRAIWGEPNEDPANNSTGLGGLSPSGTYSDEHPDIVLGIAHDHSGVVDYQNALLDQHLDQGEGNRPASDSDSISGTRRHDKPPL